MSLRLQINIAITALMMLFIGALVAVGGGLSLMLREQHGGHLTKAEAAVVEEEAVSPIP